jgi:sterol desaturase/sphingolipid hydroxylase (fatty acid hydroxylase superfamily)
MLKFLVRLLYLPLFLIGGNGIAIYVVTVGYSKFWLLVVAFAFIVLAFLLERAAPYDFAFNKSYGDRVRDFLHFLVNEASNVLGIASVPIAASFIALPSVWPDSLPLWQQLLLAIFIADIGITLAHFASHRIGVLWRLHAVHHSVKRMYGFNGLMKHPLHQFIETVAGTTPLLLMGILQDVLALFVVAVVLQLLLQHSNVAYFTGPLKYLLAINVVHRFHHLKTAEEGDVNFGLFTTLTDWLIGTHFYDKTRTIGDGDLGIGDQPDYPVGYLKELVMPFRKSRPELTMATGHEPNAEGGKS